MFVFVMLAVTSSLCTDCSFSGLKQAYPNCNTQWQEFLWNTDAVPSHSYPGARWIALFRFVLVKPSTVTETQVGTWVRAWVTWTQIQTRYWWNCPIWTSFQAHLQKVTTSLASLAWQRKASAVFRKINTSPMSSVLLEKLKFGRPVNFFIII